MENMISKNQQMLRSKPEFTCRKHTNHNQSPGVCSVCLGERLSFLSTSSCSTTMASSCSSSSSHFSSFGTSPAHHRIGPDAKGSKSFFRNGKDMLTKSRSMVFGGPRMRGGAVEGKKKRGFWSKLLRRRSKKMDEGLVYSVTMREMMSSTRL